MTFYFSVGCSAKFWKGYDSPAVGVNSVRWRNSIICGARRPQRPSQLSHTLPPSLFKRGAARLSFTARIEGAHSDCAASASKKDGLAVPLTPFQACSFLCSRESLELSFTARIERAQFYRARSASKKDSLAIPYPPLEGVLMLDHGFRVICVRKQSCSPKEAQASDHARSRPASRTVAVA